MGRTVDNELWTPFVSLWNEAVSAGMTAGELSALTGVSIRTLQGRRRTLRKRGIILRPLVGGRSMCVQGLTPKRASSPAAVGAPAPKRMPESMVIYVM